MFAHLSLQSSNVKTGPIPVSSSCRATCPPSCPLKGVKGGCYGEYGPISQLWARIERKKIGEPWPPFCEKVKAMPANQLWRHNQIGDLPGRGGRIDPKLLEMLVEANLGKRGFTYTHYDPFKGNNAELIRYANLNGFTINLSANSLTHADRLAELDIAPVVTILPSWHKEDVCFTPEGRRVVVCLAERVEYMTCAVCKQCLHPNRSYIVGFRTHGTCYKRADQAFIQQTQKWCREGVLRTNEPKLPQH